MNEQFRNARICPYCGKVSRVTKSEPTKHGFKRIRRCTECKMSYETVEVIKGDINYHFDKQIVLDEISDILTTVNNARRSLIDLKDDIRHDLGLVEGTEESGVL